MNSYQPRNLSFGLIISALVLVAETLPNRHGVKYKDPTFEDQQRTITQGQLHTVMVNNIRILSHDSKSHAVLPES